MHVVLSAGKIRGMNCSCSSMILPSSENSSHQLHNGVIANILRNASLKALLLLSSAYGEELLLIYTLWKIERGPHQCFVIAEYKSKALWVVSTINCIQSTLDSVIISYLLLSTCYAVNYCCVALRDVFETFQILLLYYHRKKKSVNSFLAEERQTDTFINVLNTFALFETG